MRRNSNRSNTFVELSAAVGHAASVCSAENHRPFRNHRNDRKNRKEGVGGMGWERRTSFQFDDQRRLVLVTELNNRHLFVFVGAMRRGRGRSVDRFGLRRWVVDFFFVGNGGVLHRFAIERIDVMNVVEMPFDRPKMRKFRLTQRTTEERFASTRRRFRWRIRSVRRSMGVFQRGRIRTLTNGQTTCWHLRVDSTTMYFGHVLTQIAACRVHQPAFVALKRSFV